MRGLVQRPPWALSGWMQLPTTTAPPPPYLCRPCRLLAAAAAARTTTSTLPVALSGMRVAGRRGIQISAAPATEFPKQSSVATDAFGAMAGDKQRDDADARFEVLGSPYSLLSVALSASQPLYTRRGTLVAVAGKVANAHSTLTVLPPVRRALLGIPFLYQRIASPTPLTLLVGTRAAATTLFTLHLDGTTDWVVAQRNALLAWTGHTLAITPRRAAGAAGLGVAHWGQSYVTGRGLVALAAPGYIYPVTLDAGEELVVHPSHVVAYAVDKHAPQPFRFGARGAGAGEGADEESGSSSVFGAATAAASSVGTRLVHVVLQVPALAPVGRFVAAMRTTATYTRTARALAAVRAWLRRTVWGDRLFVHVRGPATLLLASRGVRVADVLTRDEVDEIADTPAGAVPAAVAKVQREAADDPSAPTPSSSSSSSSSSSDAVAVHVATVRPDGKVEFTDAKDLKEFVR